MIQIFFTLLLFLILVFPTGRYMFHIATKKKTFADPIFNRIDSVIYKITGVREDKAMGWVTYTACLLLTNAVMVFIGYLLLRIQSHLFLNPNDIGPMNADLAFNTIISFMTNTNLQHYAGESGLSYLSQMTVITFLMFTSAASGYAACIAFIRGLVGKTPGDVGNFFTDLIRITTRVLLPFSIIVSLVLIWQGVPQNLSANETITTIEGKLQNIAMGPIASLESIKHIGTNGGGFLGANSSTPLENPTIISNIVELLSMMLLPGACVVMFGLMVSEVRKECGENIRTRLIGRDGMSVFVVMSVLFLIGLTVCVLSERVGNPIITSLLETDHTVNMEGKEVRFGIDQSALFTTVTTSFTTGTVNNMHDSLTPLGGMVPLMHMMLNLVFGGKGVGLMNMIMYVILTVFICGLMVGRTPEYLGRKIEGREMKLTALCIIIHPLLILAFSAVAVATEAGRAGITNPGFHGLSQVLYEYTSSAANNGSGFEGLADNTLFWNVTTGLTMIFGRYLSIIIQMAIAGSLAAKRTIAVSAGTLKTDTVTFTVALIFIIYIFAALTFFPVLALGPVAEHLTIWSL